MFSYSNFENKIFKSETIKNKAIQMYEISALKNL